MSQYCRHDVLRIFGIRERQLRLWERNGLIACADCYSFQELGQLRKLRELGASRVPAGSIREAIHAMRSVSGLPDPLGEAALTLGGARRLAFRHSGAVVEPVGGQYLLDFSGNGKPTLAAITVPAPPQREREAAQLFAEAVRAEGTGRLQAALEGYEAVLALAPRHPAAAINLGTLHYGRRDYARAEQFYRMATESDPGYALAFFDLGNVLDELKRIGEAIAAYRRAVELEPGYADAHYNLALALERHGRRRSALEHWTAYLRLDGTGPWAQHARIQLRKTLGSTGLGLVRGNGNRRDSSPPPALRVV